MESECAGMPAMVKTPARTFVEVRKSESLGTQKRACLDPRNLVFSLIRRQNGTLASSFIRDLIN
jgi:hypothetical protein